MNPKQAELLEITATYILPVSVEELREAYAVRSPDDRLKNRPSALYKTLQILERDGYVVASAVEGDPYPEYTISEAGKAALRVYKKAQSAQSDGAVQFSTVDPSSVVEEAV